MNPQPDNLAAAIAAAISSFSLAIFGVDYYASLAACIGAMWALVSTDTKMGRWKSMAFVAFSTFAGAVFGGVVVLMLQREERVLLLLAALAGGRYAPALLDKLKTLIESLFERFLGSFFK